MTFSIIDIHTKQSVGKPYNDRQRARNRANKLDMQYGACRYVVRTNFQES